MKSFPLLCALIIFCSLSGCKKKTNPREALESKYPPEAFNYFYEVFFNYPVDRKRSIEKWDKDIYFFVEGDTLPGDLEIVREISERINEIGLPVTIREAKKREEANLYFSSDTKAGLKLDSSVAAMTFKYPWGRIDSAKVVISENATINREAILLHEFLHAMGFTSHVSTTSGTAVMPWNNGHEELSQRDILTLKLLYEPVWPPLYYREDFESDFAAELYHIEGEKKFLAYLKREKIALNSLDNIIRYGLKDPLYDSIYNPAIFKIVSPLKVKMKGDVSSELLNIVKGAIREINLVTPELQVSYADDTIPGETGIYFQLENDPSFPADSIDVKYIYGRRPKLLNSKFKTLNEASVSIHFNEADEVMKKVVPSIIYRLITLHSRYDSDEFEVTGNEIQLKPAFREILKVYTAPELPHNLPRPNLIKLRNTYQNYLNQEKEKQTLPAQSLKPKS